MTPPALDPVRPDRGGVAARECTGDRGKFDKFGREYTAHAGKFDKFEGVR